MRKRLGVVLGLLLLLTVGLFLPQAVSYVQDGAGPGAVKRYEIEDISLRQMTVWTFEERLKYAEFPMASIEAEQGKKMDASAAEEAVHGILRELEQSGTITPAGGAWTLEQVKPTMVAGRMEILIEDARQLTLYYGWLCRATDEAGNEFSMLLDDETGKLLSALYIREDREEQLAITEEVGRTAAMRWAEFCERSYGYTFQSIRQMENTAQGRLSFNLFFVTDSEEPLKLTCAVGPGVFKFQAIMQF